MHNSFVISPFLLFVDESDVRVLLIEIKTSISIKTEFILNNS